MKKILVIEDNEVDSSQIVKMIQDDFIEVSLATTGKKALKRIASFGCGRSLADPSR